MALSVTQFSGFGADNLGFVHHPRMMDFTSGVYLTRGADLTGNADGKLFIFSAYFHIRGGDSTDIVLCANGTLGAARFSLRRANSNLIRCRGKTTGDVQTLLLTSTNTYTTTSNPGRHHLLITANVGVAGAAHLYVDGVEEAVVETFSDNNIDFTGSNFSIGSDTVGAYKFVGCLGQVYVNLAEYDNTPTDYYNNGYVDFGATGSGPTGTQPIVFLNNALSTWQENLGSGGNFTENGTLANCN